MFKVKIERFNVQFQILSELAAWDDYFCSPETKALWIKKSGGALSEEEKTSLETLASVLKVSQNDILGNLLFRTNSEIKYLRRKKEWKDEFAVIDSALKTLKNRITRIEKKLSSSIKRSKNKLLSQKNQLDSAFKTIPSFLGLKLTVKQFGIFILFPKVGGYEAWTSGNNVILIPPVKGYWDDVYKTIAHEYTHILLSHNQNLQKKITIASKIKSDRIKKIQKLTGLSSEQILEELFVSSLVPEGELANLLFPKSKPWISNIGEDLLERSRKEFADRMVPHVRKRLNKELSSQEFVAMFIKELNGFLKNK